MKYIQYLSACLLIPVLFGCQRQEFDQVDGIGTPVKFAVATGYETGTRTEFSGVLTGTTSTVERIDWTNGDMFRVNDNGSQSTDLTVTASTPNGSESVATISGTSLVWENASATFYALYPSPATTGVTASLTNNTATGTIPSAQTVTLSGREYKADMAHYGYMCASATANAGSAVSLVFKPLMTAFRFQIYAMDGCAPTANLTSVSLSSATTSLAGNFTATIGANSAFTATGTGTNTVSASLGTGLALSTTEPVTVTLLAMPVVQDQLTLTLGFSDNTTRSIPFKEGGNWVSVQPGQKMYVDNLDVPGESRWNYYLGDLGTVEINGQGAVSTGLDFTVTSYRYNTLNPSVNEAVAWTVEYSADGTNWYGTLAAAGIDDKFSVSPTSGNGGVTGDPVHTEITRPHDGTNPAEYASGNSILADETAAMKLKTIPSGAKSSDGYYDLSKHAIYGASCYGAATTQETANCYVIDRPGKYKFPLTYGNAIRNGATNTIAFAPDGTNNKYNDNKYYMKRFQRHDGYEINNPSVIGQIGGGAAKSTIEIIWQTGTDEILKQSDITYNFRTNSSDNYVYFEIKEENIRPGNILIGLRYNGGIYLWSWHIWVTNQDMTPTDGFLNQNLGWIYSPTASTEKWADWDFYVKVKQTGTGGLEKIFAVHQIGDGTVAGAERGNSLFYQWGRKDPFPVDWTDYQMYHDHTITTAAASNTNGNIAPNISTLGGMLANHAINQPYTIFVNATTHHWLQGTDNNSLIGNLWDATLSSDDSGAASKAPVKSVYDPSPRGFVVPNSGVYSSFTTSSPSEYIANQGWYFGTTNGTVFFPLGGGQDENETALTGGYVWSTTSDSYNDATLKHKSQLLEFGSTSVTPISHRNKADLLPVRPIAQ